VSNLYWLTDAQMERLKPFFPKSHGNSAIAADLGLHRGEVFEAHKTLELRSNFDVRKTARHYRLPRNGGTRMEAVFLLLIVALAFVAYRARSGRSRKTEQGGGIEISIHGPRRPSGAEKRPGHEQNPALEKLALPEDPRVEKWVGWNFCGHVEVAGVQHHKDAATEAYRMYRLDSDVSLIRDPGNQHDPNAIQVVFGEKLVGFIDRETAALAAKLLSPDMPIRAKYKKGWLGKSGFLELHIQPLMPDSKSRKANGWVAAPRSAQT
jgi:hypothetical protein